MIMKDIVLIIFFGINLGKTSKVIFSQGSVESKIVEGPGSETIPNQPKFTSLECFYCGVASKYIGGLSPAFSTFYPFNQNFQNYLDTVASLVCDQYGTDDAKHCDITARYVALYVYANWVGDSTSFSDSAKTMIEWANNFFSPLCEGNEEMELFCLSLDALSLSLSFCREGIVTSAACPAELTACEVCAHYFQCSKSVYC
uniref:Saposin B-type domain-containing protein n=1 Tax=Panagrolaimus superbus TaxID=310955 RepID=A0A914YLX8_9BILA